MGTSRNAVRLKLLVQISDILVLNGWMFVLYLWLAPQPVIPSFVTYWIIGNVSYVIGLNCVTVILHKRITQVEDIITRVGKLLVVQAVVFLAILSLFHIEGPAVLLLILFYGFLFCLIVLERLVLRSFIKRIRNSGKNSCNAILIGEGPNIVEIAEKMSNLWYGYRVVGIFSDEETKNFPSNIYKIGAISEAVQWLSENEVDEVYCGLPSKRADEIMQIINYCENNLIHFYSVPNLRNYCKREVSPTKLGDLTVLAIREEPLGSYSKRALKRAFDLVVSSLFLCTVYPVLLLIVGIAVKISSPGPIYFKQDRTGIDGKTFRCIKFRSMRVNGDSDKMQATKHDPRKTKTGDFLRKTNLDEFPQFINVWKGEMSIVGPRPHMLKHTEEYSQLIHQYMVRHLVKPGITGWAQINGCRGETQQLKDMQERVKHDIWYLENWTFWLDLRIIVKTVSNMFRGEDKAY